LGRTGTAIQYDPYCTAVQHVIICPTFPGILKTYASNLALNDVNKTFKRVIRAGGEEKRGCGGIAEVVRES
jgi:hypothetical protein